MTPFNTSVLIALKLALIALILYWIIYKHLDSKNLSSVDLIYLGKKIEVKMQKISNISTLFTSYLAYFSKKNPWPENLIKLSSTRNVRCPQSALEAASDQNSLDRIDFW